MHSHERLLVNTVNNEYTSLTYEQIFLVVVSINMKL